MTYRCYGYFCLILFLAVSGCSNNTTKKDESSGFISNYSDLKSLNLPSGTVMLHWRNDSLKPGQYTKIILDPTVFYPKPQVNDNVSAEILNAIKTYVDQRLIYFAKKNNIEVTQKPGKGVLRVRSAFTAITITGEKFSMANLLPVMLVVNAAELSVGGRDQDVTMVHEFEVVDSLSNESMIRGVRKGKVLELSNKKEKLTMALIKPLMEKWGMDIEESFNNFSKNFINE